MVEAYGAFMVLMGVSIITAFVIGLIPEKFMNKVWQKLHLDNDTPYAEVDED